ncbi:MAG TPA: nicotinate (nicotinamide) nucleotide adenylyltransferase [Paenalcaligenes sp.]|nr:nicotinate (nicotinamide) nucleotide adenylyltransferase [Paenalcaligenes sp.]
MNKVGLLGGSFDPVHKAHIALAKRAVDALQLDRLELIPAANPWQRAPLKGSAEHRLAMLQLAIDHNPILHINPIELERTGPTYTLDTLQQLPTDAQYYWVLGSDQLQNFHTWQGWQEILQYVTLAVAQRPGATIQPAAELSAYLQANGLTLETIDFEPMDISATEIRSRLKQHRSTDGLLEPKVQQYIKRHQLYL